MTPEDLAKLVKYTPPKMTYTCEYCKKSFVKESSLVVHSCEPRKRRMEQNEPGVRIGFHTFIKFFEQAHGSAKLKTFEDFATSPYYKAFVKFGRYCVDTKVISPLRFSEWILKSNKKIDYWCKDSVYEEFLLQYLKLEAMEDALTRAIEHSMNWAETHNAPSQDYLRYGNHNTIIHDIVAGRVSAWVLYNSESGQKFLEELTTEQQAIIWPYIDPDVWMRKLKENAADRNYAQELLKQAGW